MEEYSSVSYDINYSLANKTHLILFQSLDGPALLYTEFYHVQDEAILDSDRAHVNEHNNQRHMLYTEPNLLS